MKILSSLCFIVYLVVIWPLIANKIFEVIDGGNDCIRKLSVDGMENLHLQKDKSNKNIYYEKKKNFASLMITFITLSSSAQDCTDESLLQ